MVIEPGNFRAQRDVGLRDRIFGVAAAVAISNNEESKGIVVLEYCRQCGF